ncbi:MAG: hypothetical protein K9M54_12380 [Kiritimatiellales bacterium]|nr:hypothetical protein [Kiritimatiellales bacterium]MCF7864661.1 hypothetical protein [Kiritimatiellales bacterium]
MNAGKLIGILAAAWGVGVVQAAVIYSNDFSGAVGTAGEESAPTTTIGAFRDHSAFAFLDGSGHLEATAAIPNANYRVYRGLTGSGDPSIAAVKCTVAMRAPTDGWLGVGFHGLNANGLTSTNSDSGPWATVTPSGVVVYGGSMTTGSLNVFSATHKPGERIDVAMTYHPATKTLDLAVNGIAVANGVAIAHLQETTGTAADPMLQYFQLNFFNQTPAADGGAYVDGLVVETMN